MTEDRCGRCGIDTDILTPLHRYAEHGSIATERVCHGCMTSTEHAVAARVPDTDVQAFVLAHVDTLIHVLDALAERNNEARELNAMLRQLTATVGRLVPRIKQR